MSNTQSSINNSIPLHRPSTGVLISPWPDLLPDVFCFVMRIFLFVLVLLYMYIYICIYIYVYIYSTNIPPIMVKNKIYEHQNLLSL